MKIRLFLIAIFALQSLSAQSLLEPYRGAEPPRGEVVPFNKSVDAASGNVANSTFVAKLADWQISADGKEQSSSFVVPVWWLNRQVIVRVERSTSSYELLVEGRSVGFAASGATPVEFNVTKFVKEGRNSIAIRHTDAEQNRISAVYASQKPTIGEVMAFSQPTIRVRDIACSTTINDNGDGIVVFDVPIKCDALNPKHSHINYTVFANDTVVLARGSRDISLDMRREEVISFMASVPKNLLWSLSSPHLLTVELDNRIDNRPSEYIRRVVGARYTEVKNSVLYINNEPTTLRLADYDATKEVTAQVVDGVNGLVVPAYYATEELLYQCDKMGVAVFVQAAVDTSSLGDSICIGGNPSNDPFWLESYLSINRAAYFTTRYHPSVLGFAIAKGTTTGTNVYDTYLMFKQLEPSLPIVYEGAGGEWCSDRVLFR